MACVIAALLVIGPLVVHVPFIGPWLMPAVGVVVLAASTHLDHVSRYGVTITG